MLANINYVQSLAKRLPSSILFLHMGEIAEFSIAESDVTSLRYHCEALGLIQAVGSVHKSTFGIQTSTTYIAWTITEKGRRYVTQDRAIRRLPSQTTAT